MARKLNDFYQDPEAETVFEPLVDMRRLILQAPPLAAKMPENPADERLPLEKTAEDFDSPGKRGSRKVRGKKSNS